MTTPFNLGSWKWFISFMELTSMASEAVWGLTTSTCENSNDFFQVILTNIFPSKCIQFLHDITTCTYYVEMIMVLSKKRYFSKPSWVSFIVDQSHGSPEKVLTQYFVSLLGIGTITTIGSITSIGTSSGGSSHQESTLRMHWSPKETNFCYPLAWFRTNGYLGSTFVWIKNRNKKLND